MQVKHTDAVATQLVQVVAPANLQEGYSFQAMFEGTPFFVTVPAGGVKQGQILIVPFEPMASTEATPLSSAPLGSADDIVLHGAWRDDIFDCFKFGFCHPSVCMACFFPQLLMAQILTRLKRNLWGVPEPNGGYEKTFRHMVFLVLAYYIASSLLKPPVPSTLKESHGHTITVENEHYPLWKNILYNLVFYAYAVYTFVILVRLRATIRRQYEIPVRYFGALEDGCCAFWLSCCTLAQLARQTANYQEKRALFCSNNGLASSSSTLTMDV